MARLLRVGALFAIYLTIMGLVALSPTIAPVHTLDARIPTQDLKCYFSDVTQLLDGTTDPPPVTVSDQFGTETIDPDPFLFLCMSALKNNPYGRLENLHWNIYGASGTIDPPPIVLTDQFGTETVDPGTARFLMVPTIKQNSVPPPGAPHFKCYSIPRAGSATVGVPPAVTLTDQFRTETVNLILPALTFCTPALKNGVGTLNAPHFILYRIRGPTVATNVFVSDQFFSARVDVSSPTLFITLADKQLVLVGGQILPNDQIASSTTGEFTNVYWILAIFAGIAGAAIIITRAKRQKVKEA